MSANLTNIIRSGLLTITSLALLAISAAAQTPDQELAAKTFRNADPTSTDTASSELLDAIKSSFVNPIPTTSRELKQLLQSCDDDTCMSYVYGSIGGIAVYALLAEKPSPFCAKHKLQPNEIKKAILDTIDKNPAVNNLHPAIAILTAYANTWPCTDQIASSSKTTNQEQIVSDLKPVSPEQIDLLKKTGTPSLILGPQDAPDHKQLIVFSDPNCPHCHAFSKETDILAKAGWKITFYPVAVISKDSIGYSAVALALQKDHPDVADAINTAPAQNPSDIDAAMKIAENMGLSSKEITTALGASSAFANIDTNTKLFFDLGAKGTPTWILMNSLNSGFVPANEISTLGESIHAEILGDLSD